jgi:NADP-reducing hydrogenase subunit HndB
LTVRHSVKSSCLSNFVPEETAKSGPSINARVLNNRATWWQFMLLKSREDLQNLREATQGQLAKRDAETPKIIIGMGTCGVAAGGQAVYDALQEELQKQNLKATVVQTGCIGMCVREPLVDIQLPGRERITYGNVKPDDIPRIVGDHLIRGEIVEDLVVARFVQI